MTVQDNDGHGAAVGRRVGGWVARAWRWLENVLRGPDPEDDLPSAPPGRLFDRRDLTSPLVVPARGYVYMFNVQASLIWESDGLSYEVLQSVVTACMPTAIRRLLGIVAGRARHQPPHHARELELELQRLLRQEGGWTFQRGGDEVRCRAYVWVELDARVQEAITPYWEQIIKLDCEHDIEMKRAKYAEALSRQWLDILSGIVDSPLAGGAAQLTQKEFAAVVEKIVAERKAFEERINVITESRANEGDPFERLEHFDRLVDRLQQMARPSFADGRHPPNGTAARDRGQKR